MVATDTAIRYRIDAGMSRFTVRAFATGLFSSLGHNPTLAIRDYTGEATFVSSNPEQSAIRISVKPASLTVTDDVSQKDRAEIENRMNQDVLETSGYPEIVFESSQVAANSQATTAMPRMSREISPCTGSLASEKISAQVSVTGDVLRAYGEFSCARVTTVSSRFQSQAER